MTRTAASALREIPHGIFTLFFPADCRLCKRALLRYSRVPVCDECLDAPAPLETEFFCTSCRAPFLNASPLDAAGVCRLCRSGLRGFDHAATFGFYEGTLRSLIHLFKYRGVKPLGKTLGTFAARALAVDDEFDFIVPVPLHWRKRLARGFNQAEALAKEIGRRRHLPVVDALRRRRHTEVQASLALAARRRNVAAAFEMTAGNDLRGKRILLVDDVMTTGATASACALALKRGGAKSVSFVAVARVDRRFTP